MREGEVRKVLIEYLRKNKIEFREEVNLGGCKIDLIVKNNNNWFGVEIKGGRAKETSTIGQLLNYYRFLSHLILCAPKEFTDRIKNLILNNPELRHLSKKLGIMAVDNGRISFTKPQNSKYYFFIRKSRKEKRKYYSRFPKYGRLDDTDISILNLIKNRGIITLGEIAKLMNLKYENTRKKIKNLEHFKYLKILSKYPTTVSIRDENEKRPPNHEV